MNRIAILLSTIMVSAQVTSNEFDYQTIAKRYSNSALSSASVEASKMQGECLVGLKELNFKKKNEFDPVAEWTSYRSASLLEQYSPCEVLIIMEVAQAKLKSAEPSQ